MSLKGEGGFSSSFSLTLFVLDMRNLVSAHLLQAKCGGEGQCWYLNELLLTDVFTLAKMVGLIDLIRG